MQTLVAHRTLTPLVRILVLAIVVATAFAIIPSSASASTAYGPRLSQSHSTSGAFGKRGTFYVQAVAQRPTISSVRATTAVQVVGTAGLRLHSAREYVEVYTSTGARVFSGSCAAIPPTTYETTVLRPGGVVTRVWTNNYATNCVANVGASSRALYNVRSRWCFDLADDGSGTLCSGWSITRNI